MCDLIFCDILSPRNFSKGQWCEYSSKWRCQAMIMEFKNNFRCIIKGYSAKETQFSAVPSLRNYSEPEEREAKCRCNNCVLQSFGKTTRTFSHPLERYERYSNTIRAMLTEVTRLNNQRLIVKLLLKRGNLST
jgi:hypothetical protein